ncbi:MAG: superinfection exclusion B family protein [Desulfobacteraceae bacterium]|nr:superinfection exclusion B family protein [Desulfobacteraceae bacterium]
MYRSLFFSFTLLVFFCASAAFADIVILKSGQTIKNADVSEKDGVICCETNEKTYYLDKASVESIVSTGPEHDRTELPGWVEALGSYSPRSLSFIRHHKPTIVIALWGIGFIFAVLLLKFFGFKGFTAYKDTKSKKILLQSLEEIDAAEKSVLREFFIEPKNTVEMPIDDPVVAGLIEKQILKAIRETGQYSIRGLLLPIQINPQVKEHVTRELVGYSDNGADRKAMMDSRPDFINKVDDYWVT